MPDPYGNLFLSLVISVIKTTGLDRDLLPFIHLHVEAITDDGSDISWEVAVMGNDFQPNSLENRNVY